MLRRYGQGVAIEECIIPLPEGEGYNVDPDKPVKVSTYLPLERATPRKQRRIEESLWHLSFLGRVGPLKCRELEEEEWAEAWKEHFHPHHVGSRLVIKPSWREYVPARDEVVIEIDPGMAFGTGLHPSTRLCLMLLERHLTPGMEVLDLGTGSGILAIAAAKLGAASVLALDLDSLAVKVARANVRANKLVQRVRVRRGTLGADVGRERFQMVVANISADVIVHLAHPISSALAWRGLLIASGILEGRLEGVASSLAQAGLGVKGSFAEGEWRALLAEKQAG